MRKDDLNVQVFKAETEDHSMRKILHEKKYGSTGLVSEKTEALFAELN